MKLFIIILFSLSCIPCKAQPVSKSWIDLNYAGDTMIYHRLDIYLPEIKKPAYPVVIAVYGSAWFGNNLKNQPMETIGRSLLQNGFAVVTPNHRSSKDAHYPAQIHDIKAVIRFVRANAAKYQLDTSFIGITGGSSGGHLAALAGTSGLVNQYQVNTTIMDIEGTVSPHTTFSSEVDAVVDWFGPSDFLKEDSCGSVLVHNAPDSPESSLIGGPIQDNVDKCALANPITYIDSRDPPFLLIHGDADRIVPHCQSEILFKALQKKGVPSQYVLVPGAKHVEGLMEEIYFKMMVDFFMEEAKKK